jgi:Fic family protein
MNENEQYFLRENPSAAYKGEWQANQYVNSLVGRCRLFETEEIVKELHKRVITPLLSPEMRDRYAGEYRYSDIMGVVGAGLSIPPAYEVPKLMRNFGEMMDVKLNKVKCDNSFKTDDFIRSMGYAHYELVKIHPFIDGNGRVARHFLAFMCKLACLKPIIIAPRHRNDYINSLEQVNITGNQDHLNKFLAKRWLESYSETNKHEIKQISEIQSFISSLNQKPSV